MSLIGKFAHLPGRPRAAEATPLLEKIASQVKPIMKRRGWKVGVLGEFFPDNPALLGINIGHGQRINLRLRPPDSPSSFYDYDQLVLVMLHELTHIVHGPHDTAFYKLLSELEEEYYDLKRKGYSGEGFHSDGNRLQGTRLNEYEGRRRGLAAAEKRLAQQRTMGRGGVLGGSKTTGKSMREIVAEAAERRLKDDKSCKVDTKEAEEEARKAQEESVITDAPDEVIEIGDSSEDEGGNNRERPLSSSTPLSGSQPRRDATSAASKDGAAASSSRSRTIPSTKPSEARALGDQSRPGVTPARAGGTSRNNVPATPASSSPADRSSTNSRSNEAAPTEWSCGTCTLINPMSAMACDACTAPRPPQQSKDGWYCDFCGAGPREMGFWSCVECGWVRKWG